MLVGVAGVAADAVGRTAVPGVVVPGAAAQQPVCILGCHPIQPRAPVFWCPLVAVVPVVEAPLPHIPVHVVKAPGVGREAPHRRCLLAVLALGAVAIDIVGVVVGQVGGDRFAEVEGRGGARPAGVFPLGFARQGVAAARALAQAAAELHRIKPAHSLHRPLVGAALPLQQAGRLALEVRRIGIQFSFPALPLPGLPSSHHPPLGLGDRRLAHEASLQLHPMLRTLAVAAFQFVLGGTHPEPPGRDPEHREGLMGVSSVQISVFDDPLFENTFFDNAASVCERFSKPLRRAGVTQQEGGAAGGLGHGRGKRGAGPVAAGTGPGASGAPPGAVRIGGRSRPITGAGLDPSCAPAGIPSNGSDAEGCWGRQTTRNPTLLLTLPGSLWLR